MQSESVTILVQFGANDELRSIVSSLDAGHIPTSVLRSSPSQHLAGQRSPVAKAFTVHDLMSVFLDSCHPGLGLPCT